MDTDHINVLNRFQMERLLRYVGFNMKKIYIAKGDYKEKHNWSMITVAR